MDESTFAKELKQKAHDLDRDTTMHTLADLLREASAKITDLAVERDEYRNKLLKYEKGDDRC